MRRRRWVRLPGHASRLRQDVDEEIGFHLASRIEDLCRAGHDAASAEAMARREFGDAEAAGAELAALDGRSLRRSQSRQRIEGWRDDIGASLRAIRRSPLFSLTVIGIMGVGIAASASMFSLVDRLMLRAAPHVVDADRLGVLYHEVTVPAMGRITQVSRSYVDLQAAAEDRTTFKDVGGFMRLTTIIGAGPDAREVHLSLADAGFFRVVGVQPAFGRFYSAAESGPTASQVAIISYGMWQRDFGGRADVIGKTIDAMERRLEIVGVTPRGFRGIGVEPTDLYVPLGARTWLGGDPAWVTEIGYQFIRVVVRLADGVTRAEAEARGTVTFRRVHDADQYERTGDLRIGSVIPGRGPESGGEGRVSVLLLVVSVLVLLIATANAANLLLTRAARRRREVAVRLALGVGGSRLARQFVTEATLLCVSAAGVALLVSRWAGQAVRLTLFPAMDKADLVVDLRVVLVAAAASTVAGILIGLAPAMQAWKRDLTVDLKTGARDGGQVRSPLRTGLVVAQATLSVVLLVGAVLFTRSLQQAVGVNLGFDADLVQLVQPILRRNPGETGEARGRGYEAMLGQMRDRARRLPYVTSASLSTTVPFWMNQSVRIRVEGLDSIPNLADGTPSITSADTSYFMTMGIRIVRGRAFDGRDVAGAPRVAVINQNMKRQLFPGRDALGTCLYIGSDSVPPCTLVVGIMTSARRRSIGSEASAQYVVPLAQRAPTGALALLVRTASGDRAYAQRLGNELRSTDPRVVLQPVQPLRALVEPHVRSYRIGTILFVAFGTIALLLSAVGLYSVVAYDAAQRAREMGVRLALGARGGSLVGLVVRDGLRSAGAGVLVGIVIALLAAGTIREFLFDVSPRDPVLVASAGALLLAVACLATLGPAWRASRLDPMIVLREE